MSTPTTKWELAKPHTGEQDLAETVAGNLDKIDDALLSQDQQDALDMTWFDGSSAALERAEALVTAELLEKYEDDGVEKYRSVIHDHGIADKAAHADYADGAGVAEKVEHCLDIVADFGAGGQTTHHYFNGMPSGYFDVPMGESAAADAADADRTIVEVSAKGHTHNARDLVGVPWFFSGEDDPNEVQPEGALDGDIYIRFVR